MKKRRKGDNISAAAIVAAAGAGKRFSDVENKMLATVAGRPLIAHTLAGLERSNAVTSIVLVANSSLIAEFKKLISAYRITKVSSVVKGGPERTESVRRGFRSLKKRPDYVIIHDGARPFVDDKIIRDTLMAAARYGAAVSATPVVSTVKKASRGRFVERTLDRRALWEAHTPQIFRTDILEEAYRRVKTQVSFTDDSRMVEASGRKVKLVPGSAYNIKVTTRADIAICESLFKRRSKLRRRRKR